MSNLNEQATINWYTWEARIRGYVLWDSPVDIDPPFARFVPIEHNNSDYIDDGKAPSLLERVSKLITASPHKEENDFEPAEIEPIPVPTESKRTCFSLNFPKGSEISLSLMHEILNLLSYSEGSFSFEILAQKGEVIIQCTALLIDATRLENHFKAFYPNVIILHKNPLDIDIDFNRNVAIADFGLDNEAMLPIAQSDSLSIDPLTSIIATLGSIDDNETAIFQILFKGATAPWDKEILYAISDGQGGSFFEGYPEFISASQEKIRNPLFGVIMRVGVQAQNDAKSEYIARELTRSITTVSRSEHNALIPLSNDGYEYNDHLRNIFYRTSNRLSFLLNTKELAHFLHYPNKTVVHPKLGGNSKKTKQLKKNSKQGIYIGNNHHQGIDNPVYLDSESRLSHCHIIGATGTGKSTLIAKMMLADIEAGLGCAILEPHGDTALDILKRIPEHRKDDVIIINPADSEFPIGFNLLQAHTDAEKIVLSSDLVSAFKRHATAWGDNMTAVLQNAVNTILESTRGGTLIELKRFLIEESFRNEYLTSVDDPSLHYYWNNEYPMVRKGIAPLLTRIDTFLRPKLVRYMLAQKDGIDIAQCMRENKIVICMLSQGLIGESNSFLLGSLFLAKFNQAALARQAQLKGERIPYFLFLDEYQNFITPSIEKILSGARKYSLGLTLAQQELGQISDSSLLNSVISNPNIRICFRLGDNDAKKLASGFSFFEENDLQSLERGEAIMKIGTSSNDANLQTEVLPQAEGDFSNYIIERSREQFARPRGEVEELLISMLPKTNIKKTATEPKTKDTIPEPIIVPEIDNEPDEEVSLPSTDLDVQKEAYLKETEKKEQEQIHRSIQNYVKTLGQKRGFVTQLETETKDGGRVDVTLKKDEIHIAVEVSVTNTIDYEVKNLKKCIAEGFTYTYMISESSVHLKNIKARAKEEIQNTDLKKIKFGTPAQFLKYLDSFTKNTKPKVKRVRGYRVKSNHTDLNDQEAESRNKKIQDIILRSVKKKPKKD